MPSSMHTTFWEERLLRSHATGGNGAAWPTSRLRLYAWASLTAAAALVVGGLAAATGASAQQTQVVHQHVTGHLHAVPGHHDYAAACAAPTPRHAACMALVRTNVKAQLQAAAHPDAIPAGVGYGPSQLQSAYVLPSSTAGSGQTVAVVDAFDDPNAASDLATYRSAAGLPACGSGCFSVVNENGQTSPLPSSAGTTGWDVEESLDIDMVSAICPACRILLVEANTSDLDPLGASVDEAVKLGARYVSNSYGSTGEDPSETSWDSYYNHPGVVITASAGDAGYAVNFPATSPYVTSVGGTSLSRESAGSRGWRETAWNGTGSGCSQYERKPAWQTDTGCANRTVADVSAVADPYTGVAVYDSGVGGWLQIGGTSVSSPLIASVYALAGTPGAGSNPAQYPYDAGTAGVAAINDVTSGFNGNCSSSYLCTARPGYDGPTGLGTPEGTAAFVYRAHGTLAGTVTDAAGKPIAGASIKVGGRTATADAKGHYSLSLPAASYKATVTDYGYKTQTLTASVTGGTTTTRNFTLASIPRMTYSGSVLGIASFRLYASLTWSDGAGHSGTIRTNPLDGTFSLSLLQNTTYAITIRSIYPGYQPDPTSLTVDTSNQNGTIELLPDLVACTAIGYHPVYGAGTTQAFTGTTVPAGWKVTNTNLGYPGYSYTPGWQFTNPGSRANATGGTGNFAIVDSAHSGSGHYQDTTLTTPVTDMTEVASPELEFSSYLRSAANSVAIAQVSADGGTTWRTVWSRSGTSSAPGPQTVDVAVPEAAGKPKVLARFIYKGASSQYWEIDNVFLGQRTCVQRGGGLVIGQVTNATTNAALAGATITGAGSKAVTVAVPGGGDLYWLFTPSTGSRQFTASATGYTSQSKSVSVVTGQVTRQDFALTPK